MRLISCHIENFGKLHDYTIHFSDGANILCEENGWGKSTLAAFIRAMFYGLEGERKRSIEENERKRYSPWQGGVFGGQLTFEVGGKQYTITRTFHEQDEFELRDAKTNVISNDYSSRIGEELFKVNRESFMRTVFIAQSDCETAVTDDVNAKIGNLTENSNDLNSFEAANARLKEILNSLTPSRKTGSIAQRKNEITELERKVTVGNEIPNALQLLQDKRKEELQKYSELKEELEIVQKEQVRVSKLQTVLAKKEQWENLKQEVQNARKPFVGAIPVMEELEAAQINYGVMEKASERMITYEMSEREKEQLDSLQQLFDKGAPKEQDFAEQLENVQRLGRLRKELLEEQVRLAEEKAESEQKKPVGLVVGLILVAVGLLIVSIAGWLGLILSVVGMIVVIGFSVCKNKQQKNALQKKEDDNYGNLKIQAESLQQVVRTFIEKFGVYADEDAFINCLHELKTKVSQYEFLNDKKQKLLKANAEFEYNRNQILNFLMQYDFEQAHNLQLQLLKIRDNIQTYADAYKKMDEFQKKTDSSVLNVEVRDSELVSLPALNEKLATLTEAREMSYRKIEGYNVDLESLQVQYEEWEDNKLRLEELKSIQAQEQQKYHRIRKVQEYLGKAKESITNRYSAPILKSFSEYYEMITKASSEQFHIDANINITKDEQGKQREMSTLSSGYRDLIGICLRVALVDAMYKEERPILIMDDPFTNLDDAKMKEAKRFLEYVAEKYQVIYFTCSNARS